MTSIIRLLLTACSFVLLTLGGCGSDTATASDGGTVANNAIDITGEWTLTIDTPRGVQNPVVQITATDGKLTGTYQSFRGPLDISSVAVDGNRFSFPLQITVPIGTIEVTYEGIIEDDRMTGLVKNPRGEVPFTGQRSGL